MHPLVSVSLTCFVVTTMLGSSGASVLLMDLTGSWNVSSAARGISVMGQVPGSMYTALMENNVIKDPYYRDNDIKFRWIGQENWTYTRNFEVGSEMSSAKSILLVAEGIDTVSTVFINGRQVATTNDMYIRYTWDVKPYLQTGQNSISLVFQSAVDYAAKEAASYPYTVTPVCPQPAQNGVCHANFIRKEPCSFSWDWGPAFPTQGIWKPIFLQSFTSAIIDMATVEVMPDSTGKGWVLRTKTYFNVSSGQSVKGQLKVTLEATGISESRSVTVSADRNWAAFDLTVPQSANVERWWPNGYGKQSLYYVSFVFVGTDQDISFRQLRVGFRTIELVEDPVSSDPSHGLTFYFRVNGYPIFLKGTNWIPADSFQERITKDRLRSLLQSATEAHINGMRVWGGGVYESDDFYDLTDEVGILIWQDLMFSDALYPTDEDFLSLVRREVRYQVRRLMHRPSILLWSGNNENEGIVRNKAGQANYTTYYNDYITLYIKTIMPIVTAENPNRVFVPSSPSNGKETASEGYVAKDPGSEFYGDTHFYDYSMDEWKTDKFPIPRLTSEYGAEAWCNFDTLLSVLESSDLSYNSSQALHRQHHPDGNPEMQNEASVHLTIPPESTPDPKRFRDMIYLTQINQAMSIKTESEHYRRHQSSVLPDGRGLTMGALYWQLNDIWQAPTWASIDYSGRWKMLHYYAVRFFSPLIVSPYMDGSDVNVYVIMDQIPTVQVRDPDTQRLRFEPERKVKDGRHDDLDLFSKVEAAITGTVTVEVYSWGSFSPLRKWTNSYQLNTTAESVFRQNANSMMTEAGCTSSTDCFIYTFLNDPADGVNNWIFLAEPKDSHLRKANVTIVGVDQAQDSLREFTITLTTDAIAPFVWLEVGSVFGKFSDNGFLIITPTATVKFMALQDVDLNTMKQQLSVRSLADIY